MPALTSILTKLVGVASRRAAQAGLIDSEDQPYLSRAIIAGIPASLLTGFAANKLADRYMKREIPLEDETRVRLLRNSGTHPNLPIYALPQGTDEAFYRPPSADLETPAERAHGYVALSREHNRPGILAHELGHASIQGDGGLGRTNQNTFRTLDAIPSSVAAAAVAPALGLQFGPVAGLIGGGLAGLAAKAPTLINEWQASSRAQKNMAASGMSQPDQDKAKGALRGAFGTYLASAVAPAALIGGAAGLAKQYMKTSSDTMPTPLLEGDLLLFVALGRRADKYMKQAEGPSVFPEPQVAVKQAAGLLDTAQGWGQQALDWGKNTVVNPVVDYASGRAADNVKSEFGLGGFGKFMENNPGAYAPLIGGGLGLGAGLLSEATSKKKKKNYLSTALTGGLLGAGAGGLLWGGQEMLFPGEAKPPDAPAGKPDVTVGSRPAGVPGVAPAPSTWDRVTTGATNLGTAVDRNPAQANYLQRAADPAQGVGIQTADALRDIGGNYEDASKLYKNQDLINKAKETGATNTGLIGQQLETNRSTLNKIQGSGNPLAGLLMPSAPGVLPGLAAVGGMGNPSAQNQLRGSIAPAPSAAAAALGFPAVATPGNPASVAASDQIRDLAGKLEPAQSQAEQVHAQTPEADRVNPGSKSDVPFGDSYMVNRMMSGAAIGAGTNVGLKNIGALKDRFVYGAGNGDSARMAGGALRNLDSPSAITRGSFSPRRVLSNAVYGTPEHLGDVANHTPTTNRVVANILAGGGTATHDDVVKGIRDPNVPQETRSALKNVASGSQGRTLDLAKLIGPDPLRPQPAVGLLAKQTGLAPDAIVKQLQGTVRMDPLLEKALVGERGLFPGAKANLLSSTNTQAFLANGQPVPNVKPTINLNTGPHAPGLGRPINRQLISPGLRGGTLGAALGALSPAMIPPRATSDERMQEMIQKLMGK